MSKKKSREISTHQLNSKGSDVTRTSNDKQYGGKGENRLEKSKSVTMFTL